MVKRVFLIALTVSLFAVFVTANAEPVRLSGGVLEELPLLKDFRAARQSSFDPSGGNADGRQDWPIQPGETREMAKIEGAGAITHIWVTIASDDRNHLKNLVLRMYWDGEDTPSVESPIGDFFGQGNGKYYHYSSYPIQIGTNNGLNCFWNMPFEKGARVTVTNDGPVACGAFYYYVDYRTCDSLPKDTGRFHAQYRQEFPCRAGENYVFFETTGRGHYVGCNLSIRNRADGWWGEGDDMIYIDGEEKPTLNGTGSEDYFCGAWCYGKAFSDPFLGCPLRGDHKRNELWNVYRYHITDPIPFTKSIKVTIEHGHANDRSDDFSSVAYWYQTEPHAPFPVLPAPAERIPGEVSVYAEEGAMEAEDLAPLFGSPEVHPQSLDNFDDKWSQQSQLWFTPDAPASYKAVINAAPGEAGKFKMRLWMTVAPDYGIAELWVNGERLGQWDLFKKEGVARVNSEIPSVTIKEGENTIEWRIVDKNKDSSGFYSGVDCFRLLPL